MELVYTRLVISITQFRSIDRGFLDLAISLLQRSDSIMHKCTSFLREHSFQCRSNSQQQLHECMWANMPSVCVQQTLKRAEGQQLSQ